MATVKIGGKDRLVEEFNGRKSAQVLTLLRHISKRMPDITTMWGDFVRTYEAKHSIELDRVQARQRFGERPLIDPTSGEPIYKPGPDGLPTDEFVMAPSFLDQISEEAWEKSGHKLRIPQSPSAGEIALHLFPDVFEAAEEYVLMLLALLVTPNDVVNSHGRANDLPEFLKEEGNKLLDDALLDELMELAVVGGETVTDQYSRKAAQLGGRLGNALRLVGIKWSPAGPKEEEGTNSPETSDSTPSSSNSTSSSDSPKPTDGASEPPSTTPAGESSTVSSLA